jgi:hypothetical protein
VAAKQAAMSWSATGSRLVRSSAESRWRWRAHTISTLANSRATRPPASSSCPSLPPSLNSRQNCC